MKVYKNVTLCDEEQSIANLGEALSYSEMSKFEREFLCGLIKEEQPKRILEIGVAAGATTAVILNCIRQLGFETEVISVDYSEKYYRDNSRQTGFIAEEFKSASLYSYSHKYYLGNVIPAFIQEICAEDKGTIDFLILDTMHTLPGEILDFLVCLPFLSENAVVILHDVALNHVLTKDPAAIATGVLFSAVSAEKYYMIDHNNSFGISNISAFRITAETRKNIQDVFFSLLATWQYCPEDEELSKYRDIISHCYGEEFTAFFDRIVSSQRVLVLENDISRHSGKELLSLDKQWRETQNTYIYGCGFWGHRYYCYAMLHELPVQGMVVSDDQKVSEELREQFSVPIFHLSELRENDAPSFVLGVSKNMHLEFKNNLQKRGFFNVL